MSKQAAAAAARQAPRPVVKAADGLSEEAIGKIAQEKWDIQEDKLRELARYCMVLVRDYSKLSAAEMTKKVTEAKKVLVKYDMLYIRAWEFQERRRSHEVKALSEEAEKCRIEAEAEGSTISQLREDLEKARRRRKRYEGYEELASEVNQKKSKVELQVEIDAATAEIERLQQRRKDLRELVVLRNKRAQLLRQAVEELKQDLQRERELRLEMLGPEELAAAAAAVAGSSAETGVEDSAPTKALDTEDLEVIS